MRAYVFISPAEGGNGTDPASLCLRGEQLGNSEAFQQLAIFFLSLCFKSRRKMLRGYF